MKIKANSYFLVLILAAAVFVIVSALRMPYFESALLPLVIAALTIIMGSVQLWKELAGRVKVEEKGDQIEKSEVGPAVAWLVGFAAAIYVLGFLIAMPTYILAYIKWRRRSWLTAISISGITTVLIYGIFEVAFHTELWRGLIFQ